jgi:CO dehydrogenase maturation factor
MKKLTTMGRGGSGKTSFVALMTKYFIEKGETPLLLVDVDPDQNLAEAVGIDLKKEGKSTISELLIETFLDEGGTSVGVACLPDASLKRALEGLTKTYRYILIDSPAGLEHLNRKVTSKIDDIFDVIDPSHKSFNHVERAYRVAKEVKIEFTNFYVISGNRVPNELEKEVQKRIKQKYLGKIAYDKAVEEFVLNGKSLLELPSSSLAYNSVKQLMKDAGY